MTWGSPLIVALLAFHAALAFGFQALGRNAIGGNEDFTLLPPDDARHSSALRTFIRTMLSGVRSDEVHPYDEAVGRTTCMPHKFGGMRFLLDAPARSGVVTNFTCSVSAQDEVLVPLTPFFGTYFCTERDCSQGHPADDRSAGIFMDAFGGRACNHQLFMTVDGQRVDLNRYYVHSGLFQSQMQQTYTELEWLDGAYPPSGTPYTGTHVWGAGIVLLMRFKKRAEPYRISFGRSDRTSCTIDYAAPTEPFKWITPTTACNSAPGEDGSYVCPSQYTKTCNSLLDVPNPEATLGLEGANTTVTFGQSAWVVNTEVTVV